MELLLSLTDDQPSQSLEFVSELETVLQSFDCFFEVLHPPIRFLENFFYAHLYEEKNLKSNHFDNSVIYFY